MGGTLNPGTQGGSLNVLDTALINFLKIFFYICTMAIKTNHQLYVQSNVSRPGVHAKSKTSNHKKSSRYKKKYKGQGR
jgi:hypothetical protein